MRLRLVVLSAVLSVGLSLLPAAPAAACSCAVMPPDRARVAALWVFEGVMLRAQPTGEPERQRATFRVDRVWKGTLGREVTLDVPGPHSMCPPHLEAGEPVILYVGGTESAPRVASCARYAWGEHLGAERRALGRATRPTQSSFVRSRLRAPDSTNED